MTWQYLVLMIVGVVVLIVMVSIFMGILKPTNTTFKDARPCGNLMESGNKCVVNKNSCDGITIKGGGCPDNEPFCCVVD